MKWKRYVVLVLVATAVVALASPVPLAAKGTRTTYVYNCRWTGLVKEGKTWISEEGVLHIRGEVSTREPTYTNSPRFEGTVNTVTANVNLDLATGEGTMAGTVFVTKDGQRVWEGTFSGTLASWRTVLHGVGPNAGLKAFGTHTSPDMTETASGQFTILDPQGE